MRIGAYLSPRDDLARAVALARQADDLGYDSVWVTHGLGRDSFVVLAAYAHATRRTGLGNGVVPIYPRHPVAMAQEAATLAEVSGGRFRLGIGLSHRPSMVDALALDMGRPLDVMREYVAVVRAALTGRARFEGAYYRVAWQAAFTPPSPTAAASPRGARGPDAGAGRRGGRRGRALALRAGRTSGRSPCPRSPGGGRRRASRSTASRSRRRCRWP